MKSFTAIALENFPLIKPGDNLAKIVVETAERNGVKIEDGDIIVVAQKVVSKAEGRVVRLREIFPSEKAKEIAGKTGRSPRLVELILRETRKILKISPETLIVEDTRGLVCINAGIDKSNIEGEDSFALLPENPDASAARFRMEIKRLTGRNVAVIICDTYSRPFRRGQVNFAIGVSGIKPLKDYRGKRDLFGYILRVKNVAVVDEIAAAAELLMGQATEATPVVVFKGLQNIIEYCENASIKELEITREEDLFRDAL
ncbi:MAG: coenzyme F420-0:L-glutamate ligase [Candidatus Bathyarchaeia archaeon]